MENESNFPLEASGGGEDELKTHSHQKHLPYADTLSEEVGSDRGRQYMRQMSAVTDQILEPLFRELESAGHPFERKPPKVPDGSNSD
jgi:hypothetical protein